MSLKFDKEWQVRSAIVKVKCGDDEGTAFFIDNNKLLTAKHVVMNYFADGTPITVKLGDEEYPCTASKDETPGSNIDVAILKPIDPLPENIIDNIHPLSLLASETPTGNTYYIIGYPQEIGNGVDQIKTEVVVLHKTAHADYDVVVSRIDQLTFYQYFGYSGSPVFIENGKVVGITTDQLSKSLAFTSVLKIKDWLSKENINVDEDWRSNDMSKFGLGKCQKILDGQIAYIGSRYTPEAHVENEDIEQKLLDFACLTKEQLIASQREQEGNLANLVRDNASLTQIQIPQEEGFTFQNKVEDYLSNLYKDGGEYTGEELSLIRSLQNIYRTYNAIQQRLETSDDRILLIKGNAGLGKTHYVCHISRIFAKKQNVYLFFGSQFAAEKSLEDQICQSLQWKRDDFEKLDNEMTAQGRQAIIIIDALNEGPDAQWWNLHLRTLCNNLLNNYSRIKLIVTSRNPVDGYFPEDAYDVVQFAMTGFNDVIKAVDIYFKRYGLSIDKDDAVKMYRKDFRTPLFLKMFCEVHRLYPYFSNDAGQERSNIYFYYLSKVKNLKVSEIVDEDPERNVTIRYMMNVARASLLSYNCSTVPRWKARLYGDKICRWRTWSHSLLHAAERENLLMPIHHWQDEDGHYHDGVMFEYQTLGDFLKAYSFINIKNKTDEEKLKDIYALATLQDNSSFSDRGYFLKALFSEWDGVSKLVLDDKLTGNEWINKALKESLEFNGRQRKVVVDWLKSNVTPNLLVSFIDLFTHEEIIAWHNRMSGLTLHERDIQWTTKVNRMLDSENGDGFRNNVELLVKNAEGRIQDAVISLCWMLTSSNPLQRNIILRQLVTLLKNNTDSIIPTIDLFKDCNDPYVLDYLYAAIYGVVLRMQEAETESAIARKVYDVNFADVHLIPMDIAIRQWTLLILAKAQSVNDTLDFPNAFPPFATQPIPQVPVMDGNNGDMFGTGIASHHIYWSLYGMGDFARYVLGTDYGDNRNFYILRNGRYNRFPTSTIQDMIVYYILNQCQWGEDISSLDTNLRYGDRFNNMSERIGKKYQWLGLRWVYALLSDNCKVSETFMHNPINDNFIEHPYPWYLSTYSRMDPTLSEDNCQLPEYRFTINSQAMDNLDGLTLDQWDNERYIPEQHIELRDNDGTEWMALIDYDLLTQTQKDKVKRERFLYNNSFFYNLDDEEIIRTWASNYPFYPRNDMPEHTGSIDYLWNEIPWSDTFKRDTIYNEDDYKFANGEPHCYIKLSYVAQLQEEAKGLKQPDELKFSTVYAPNENVMNHLGLYTAERGVIRSKANSEIIAQNIKCGSLDGLFIKKSWLDRYLHDNNLGIMYCTLGEKYAIVNIQILPHKLNLSGCWLYSNGELNNIQPLRHIPQEV